MFFTNENPHHERTGKCAGGGFIKDRSDAQLPGQYSYAPKHEQVTISPPTGALDFLYHWSLATSPRPVPTISLGVAIAVLAGIVGRSHNVKGQGLNQYILIVGSTGSGKDIAQTFPEVVYSALRPKVPAIDDMRGPGELVSAPGMVKWLARNSSALCAVGEIGILLMQMAKPNVSTHLMGVERLLLQLFSKSGRKGALGAAAYSDKEKTTPVIYRPTVSIVGETTPEFYNHVDDSMIANGLFPRFMSFEYLGEQVALAKGFDSFEPCPQQLSWLADLAATALTLNNNNQICDVALTGEAEALFEQYEQFARQGVNGSSSENIKHLWNRAHLKALKLAGLCAVGLNWHNPIICADCANWAIELVTNQTRNLVGKFEAGDVGRQVNAEDKQMDDVIRAIANYIFGTLDDAEKYGGVTFELHDQQVITISNLQRRTLKLASFRKDKISATSAFNRVLKSLLEGDELREIPKMQMQSKYGTGARGFVVANPARFAKARNPK